MAMTTPMTRVAAVSGETKKSLMGPVFPLVFEAAGLFGGRDDSRVTHLAQSCEIVATIAGEADGYGNDGADRQDRERAPKIARGRPDRHTYRDGENRAGDKAKPRHARPEQGERKRNQDRGADRVTRQHDRDEI